MAPELAIGLMSGTSLDGIDAALIRSDGRAVIEPLAFLTEAYDARFRDELRASLGPDFMAAEVEAELTRRHAELVKKLLETADLAADRVSVVGFHGQTTFHDPAAGITLQAGDGQLLAELTGCPVVNDFRKADVAAGGQGAPLAPLYHAGRLLSGGQGQRNQSLAVLNLGGVGNITWIGPGHSEESPEILAFDTGPANALIDDWVSKKAGLTFDEDGRLAARGRVDDLQLAQLLAQPYFDLAPPKSLDRDDFKLPALEAMSLEDGAATLTAFTLQAVKRGVALLPDSPSALYLCGGGRKNRAILEGLAELLAGCDVAPVEALGWNGDALEAEAFAYLALRSVQGLPLSLPGTTGVAEPLSGGRLHRPRAA